MGVSLGRVLAGLKPLDEKSANPVFRGDILLDGDDIQRGFVKDLDARQMANELLVAILAHKIGVSVPRVAIVAVSKDVSPAFAQLPHANGVDHIAFCSLDAGGATVFQTVGLAGMSYVMTRLKSAPAMGRMYGFDNWIANVDRHTNNIILAGDGSTYLIDHGHCFGGPRWNRTDLDARLAYTNLLATWLTPNLSDEEKAEGMRDVHALIAGMASVNVQDAIEEAMVESLYGSDDSAAVASFLQERVAHVAAISANSLGTLV